MPERTRFGGGAGGTGGSGAWATGAAGGRRLGENSGRSTVADSRSRDRAASGLESVTLDESCAATGASAPSAAVIQHNRKTALAVRRKYVMESLAAKTR